MAATNSVQVTLDTLIVVKVSIQSSTRKFKLPLRDLGPNTFPNKLRTILGIGENEQVTFERYSDSLGSYVVLNPENVQVYKTLFRAAKAKLKLRIRATLNSDASQTFTSSPEQQEPLISEKPLPIRSIAGARSIPQTQSNVPPVLPAGVMERLQAQLEDLNKEINNRNSKIEPLVSISAPAAELPTNVAQNEHYISSWSVFCNACDKRMNDEHFHCSICDDGDFDLCSSCVNAGSHCPGEGHWLLKRFIKDGTVINSTTERVAPKFKPEPFKSMPGAFTVDKKEEIEPETVGESKEESEDEYEETRTCNSCINSLPEKEFVNCVDCEDFDLCIPCHISGKHGHHPGHKFKAATSQTVLGALGDYLCAPGRNVRHAAICDGCDKFIYGVRHKCLNCPDWDFCSLCHANAKFFHPRHRFVPIYEPLSETPTINRSRHIGIFCDGPICQNKPHQTYIEGIRYKCAVCDDTDFCENCEAMPENHHNQTHPLIRFKTPVRGVSVTTTGSDGAGAAIGPMGDLPLRQKSVATETAPFANASTQVQTIADFKPEEPKISPSPKLVTIKEESKPKKMVSTSPALMMGDLKAHFVRDVVPDGTTMWPEERFSQVWTLRNPGPAPWPAGCSVRYVGGDNMLNVDDTHPSSAAEMLAATESNLIDRVVAVGEEISFHVLMKAPKREGVAISYWRIKAANGTPFGHRLWCHIDVKKPVPPPAPKRQSSSSTAAYQSSTHAAIKEQQAMSQGKASSVETAIRNKSEREQDSQGSQMIFPKLEKESPSSSVLEEKPATAAVTSPAAAVVAGVVARPFSPMPKTETVMSPSDRSVSLFDDADTVELLDAESSDDDCFATDEEYEVIEGEDAM